MGNVLRLILVPELCFVFRHALLRRVLHPLYLHKFLNSIHSVVKTSAPLSAQSVFSGLDSFSGAAPFSGFFTSPTTQHVQNLDKTRAFFLS
jgi:hypothetical protein